MAERKLASLQRITEIIPHPNADSLEIARVLGWRVCVKKGEFKVDDPCIYVEVDSVLPAHPVFEFLRSKDFRIRTVRLRGQYSQGIAFPANIVSHFVTGNHIFKVGDDMTDFFGIKKYEAPIPTGISGDIKGVFPSFIKKTDETRIQAVPQILERYKGERFYVTEKLDGTSMTVYHKDGEFGVCGRNYELKDTESNALWRMAKQLMLHEKMPEHGTNIAIQGELIGPGIQGNKYKLKAHEFRPFTIINLDTNERLDVFEFSTLCEFFGLVSVPILDFWFVLGHTVDQLVTYAENGSVLNSGTDREGVVIRSIQHKFDEDLGDLSFKVISPAFLVKSGE